MYTIKRVTGVVIATIMLLQAQAQDRVELNSGWRCAPMAAVNATGQVISTTRYPLQGWLPATVPGTVLTTMLVNKQIPDPFYGMNNNAIPDIYTTGRDYYTYWFVNNFREPFPAKGRQVWLQLRGVNYSCKVYLNGHPLTDNVHKGMFLRQQYNITPYLQQNGSNRLAVIVFPPDPVGNPNGGQGGDGTIARNVAHQYVAGWDWIQPIRDRNTGIWDKVYLERTGTVNIKNPHIVTKVPGVRKVQGPQAPATLHVTAELENSSTQPVTGTLQYQLEGKTISTAVTLAPLSTTEITLPVLTVTYPRLWWPNGYGKQALYTTRLQFLTATHQLSDQEQVTFGIRELSKEWNTTTSSAQVQVNGQKIFIKGGNWIISDAMLRLSRERYDAEIRYHRDMNLNLIRIWGGALLERPEFYEACDRYGMLVFQDLWMSGDCNGHWTDPMKLDSRAIRRGYPDDHTLFIRSVADQVKMVRNHPSLAIWCGGNEITPPADILTILKDSLFPQLDGTRWFIDFSNDESMSANILKGGGDGPYDIQPIDTFWNFRTYPFNSEVGSVGVGDEVSLKRFIPAANLVVPQWTAPAQPGERPRTVVDSVWNYHKYIGYNQYIDRYGKATGIKDFTNKAQLINYDQYRALMEGYSSHMWQWYTGSIIWKTQNPWTAMRGQMYDYYLDPNACLYGLRKGSERVHIMYDPVQGTVMVVNNTFDSLQALHMTVCAYDRAGKATTLQELPVAIGPSTCQRFATIKPVVDDHRRTEGCFLSLTLYNSRQPVSENLYWLPNEQQQYPGLAALGTARINIQATQVKPGFVEVRLSNPAGQPVAFFNRLSLVNAATRQRVLPVFYSNNYVSVLPGGQQKVMLEYKGKEPLLLSLEGWNVPEQLVKISLP